MEPVNKTYTISNIDTLLIQNEEAPYPRLNFLIDQLLGNKISINFDDEVTQTNFFKLVRERLDKSLNEKIQTIFKAILCYNETDLIELGAESFSAKLPKKLLSEKFPYFEHALHFFTANKKKPNRLEVSFSDESLKVLAAHINGSPWKIKNFETIDELINLAEQLQGEEFSEQIAVEIFDFLARPGHEHYFDERYVKGNEKLFIQKFAKLRGIAIPIDIFLISKNNLPPKYVMEVKEFKENFSKVNKSLASFFGRELPPITLKIPMGFNPLSLFFLPEEISYLIEGFVFDSRDQFNFSMMPESTLKQLIEKFPGKEIYPLLNVNNTELINKLENPDNDYQLMLLLGAFKNASNAVISLSRQPLQGEVSQSSFDKVVNFLSKIPFNANPSKYTEIAFHYFLSGFSFHHFQKKYFNKELVSKHPQNEFVLWGTSHYLTNPNFLLLNLKNLNNAIQSNKNNIHTQLLLIKTLIDLSKGDNQNIVKLEYLEQAENNFNYAQSLEPENRQLVQLLPTIYYQQALLLQEKDPQKALNKIELLFKFSKNKTKLPLRLHRDILLLKADLLNTLSRYSDALDALDQAELYEKEDLEKLLANLLDKTLTSVEGWRQSRMGDLLDILFKKVKLLKKINNNKIANKILIDIDQLIQKHQPTAFKYTIQLTQFLFDIGEINQAKDKLDKAIKEYDSLKNLNELQPEIEIINELKKQLAKRIQTENQ